MEVEPSEAVATAKCPSPVRLYRESENGGAVQRLMLPCRSRRCSYCGPKYWKPRALAVLHSGLSGPSNRYLAVLLTAPGDADTAWNEGASHRWHLFMTYLRREYGPSDFWRIAELQERGAVHFHFILRGYRWLEFCHTKLEDVRVEVREGRVRWVCCGRRKCLRQIALRCGFGPYIGVKRSRDYPGGVRSAGYYFGKYLLKAYSVTMGVTKLLTYSNRWRVDWVSRVREKSHGWIFAGPVEAGFRLLGYELAPSGRSEPRLAPWHAPWWGLSWQARRRREAVSVEAWKSPGTGRYRGLGVRWLARLRGTGREVELPR